MKECSAERCPMQSGKINPKECPISDSCDFYTEPEKEDGHSADYARGLLTGFILSRLAGTYNDESSIPKKPEPFTLEYGQRMDGFFQRR